MLQKAHLRLEKKEVKVLRPSLLTKRLVAQASTSLSTGLLTVSWRNGPSFQTSPQLTSKHQDRSRYC